MPDIFLPASRIALRDIGLGDLGAWAHWNQHGWRWQETDGPDLAPETTGVR